MRGAFFRGVMGPRSQISPFISHVLNEQGTGYEHIFSSAQKLSIELKNGARHLKEHPKMSKFTKFDGYWFKPKGMVHLVRMDWRDRHPPIHTKLSYFKSVPCLCV